MKRRTAQIPVPTRPTRDQRIALAKTFGCARVVFNDYVATRQRAYKAGQKAPTSTALSKRLITHAKQTPERVWLGEVSAVALQQSLRDAQIAYDNFFASRNGQRAGPSGVSGTSLGPAASADWLQVSCGG